MTKLRVATLLWALALVVPLPAMAAVTIGLNISVPPPIVFQAPPEVIVMPDATGVYVVPDIAADLFFWNGWWWRPWEGRWYRSRYYDRGWGYYGRVPRFYYDVDPDWRGYYRDHHWAGHPWNSQRIPPQQLQQHWQTWQKDRHWERQGTWGVQNYRPRPQAERQDLRQQRQQQYQQRPEVQQHQEQRQQQQRSPQVQQQRAQRQDRGERPQGPPHAQSPRPQPQERGERPPRPEQRPQGQHPAHSQSHGRPEGGEGDRGR